MGYIQLIYNPMAGSKVFKSRLDYFLEVFEKAGYDVHIRRTLDEDDFENFFVNRDFTGCEAVIVAGGDGSISRTVNAMMAEDIHLPLGTIPAGTANDFAHHLAIPDTYAEAIDVLAKLEVLPIDLGKVNDQYFINVCAGGLLSNISHTIEQDMKNTLGKLAYYIKGVQQLPKFKSFHFHIETPEQVYDENLYLYLVLNGSSAGGFNRIGEYASVSDGKLDFVGFKECNVNDLAIVFAKLMRGEHLNDKNILYFQSSSIKIDCKERDELPTDIDGEEGPAYPLTIEVLHKGLTVLVNKEGLKENKKADVTASHEE